jgi:hypothetical protein
MYYISHSLYLHDAQTAGVCVSAGKTVPVGPLRWKLRLFLFAFMNFIECPIQCHGDLYGIRNWAESRAQFSFTDAMEMYTENTWVSVFSLSVVCAFIILSSSGGPLPGT